MRFPLRLPMFIKTSSVSLAGRTQNISACGVLFDTDTDMSVGANIEFTISIPADVIGTPTDVLVSGAGRVVRCAAEEGRRAVAAVIDEYRFERG
ncbi:MAG TPA: PilZ domain-containing protein [Terriglobales bacterium]|nr:PilZ domain-containing protein [Terriglobales bacterium]